jgi:hypothetical protein
MTEKPTVAEAMSAVMDDVQAVRKGDRNTQQGFNFRGIDAVVNAVGPAFRKHGIVAVPMLNAVTYNTVEVGQKRTQMRECTVTVTYRFYGPKGDYIEATVPAESMDSGDKATPKAMSVAYRTALLQVLTIPTDEPDPDGHNYERSEARREPVWDAEEQEQLREAYERDIAKAKTKEDVKQVGLGIRAQINDTIAPYTFERLQRAAAARLAEIDTEAEAAKTPAGETP